ncbi:MAG: aldehyde dehydrogenase family protein [Acidimicrobiales bacterium]|nr:aldehyde dehydrogenase family protein [Acidimicrobiales bacterium]
MAEVRAPDDGAIRAFARELAAAATPSAAERTRQALSPSTLAMGWATRRPTFKTQLFRFVDVVPACTGPADTAAHLREYLDHADSPASVRLGLRLAARVPGGDAVAAGVARLGIRQMARQFIIGDEVEAVVAALGARWQRGFTSTLDLLGEKTFTLAEADAYAGRVMAALQRLTAEAPSWPARPVLEQDPYGPISRVNLSVKPTALAPKMHVLTEAAGVAQALERLEPILDLARRTGATVHIDAEHDETKDATHALLRAIGAAWPDGPALGCVVQAYRHDAEDDLAELIRWSERTLSIPLQVRLVKGAYWDAETITARASGWANPLFERKSESDASFERCAQEMAAAAGAIRPAFASHNVRSLAAAVVACRSRSLDDSAFEIQLLHGMAEPLHDAVRDLGFRARVYSPMGDLIPGMSYLVRRLLENTANESFVRQRFDEHADLEALIADPANAPAPAPSPSPSMSHADSAGRAAGLRRWSRRRAEATTNQPTRAEGREEGVMSVTETFRNEPWAELRRAPVRRRFAAAVAATEAALGFDVPLLVAGRAIHTSDTLPSVDPGRTDRVVARQALAGPEHVEAAIGAAVASRASWGGRSVHDRADVLRRGADLLRRQRDELAALIAFEAGKPLAEADADVCEAIDFWTYYAALAPTLDATALAQVPGERNDLRYRPRGVGVVIAPWNFPLAIPAGMVGASLVMGNPVVFKPAEQTPGVALRMVQALHQAGVPAGALALLTGLGEDVGPLLVEHPDTAFVAFTGSRAVGLDIVGRAAVVQPGQRHVKFVSAEMGGKNPIVVDTDADLDAAVPAIVKSAFGYAGQKCSATSRVLAPDALVAQLTERIAGAVEVLTVAHPTDPGADLGPVIDVDAFERNLRYRTIASDEGEIVVQRDDVPDQGWYVGPTVAVVKDPAARVATEEIFGPLLAIVPVADFDEGLARANDSDYALTAGVFSRTPSHIDEAARRLEAGNIYVNRGTTGAMVARQPFGGHRLSGSGAKTGGPGYLTQFANPVVVTENTVRQGFAPDL